MLHVIMEPVQIKTRCVTSNINKISDRPEPQHKHAAGLVLSGLMTGNSANLHTTFYKRKKEMFSSHTQVTSVHLLKAKTSRMYA